MTRYLKALLGSIAFISGPVSAQTIAIVNVAVVPMNRNGVLEHQTVIVTDGRITKIATQATIPAGATRIEGGGQFLMPGLADMHVHLFLYDKQSRPTLTSQPADAAPPPPIQAAIRNELLLYLLNGVTTVRNMNGNPLTLDWAGRVAHGDVVGPHIVSATPILDGDPPSDPNGTALRIQNAEDVPAVMKMLAATEVNGQKYHYVKVYNQLSGPVYAAIVVQARKYGLPVVGHVPFSAGLDGALKARQLTIEHLRGYDTDPNAPPTMSLSVARFLRWNSVTPERMAQMAKMTVAAGTWNVPTLVTNQDGMSGDAKAALAAPDGPRQFISQMLIQQANDAVFPPAIAKAIVSTNGQQRKMVKALSDAGAGLLAGTDTPLVGNLPGFALQRELQLFVLSGLTPYQSLQTATTSAQRVIGASGTNGEIKVGMKTDLVLVKANPLLDIVNASKVSGVVISGHWWSRDAIEAELKKTKNEASAPSVG